MIACNAEVLEDDFGQLRKIGVNSRLVEIFQAMKIYTSMLEAYMNGSLLQPDLVKFCDQRNIIQHHVMSLPSADRLTGISLQERQVYEMCRISGIIYSTGVIFPLPGPTSPLPTLSRILRRNLQVFDLNLYLSLPDAIDVFLWAITLGGIACTAAREKAWYVESLKRLIVAVQFSQWSDLRQALRRILWLDIACDKAGRELWDEVVQDLTSTQGSLTKELQAATAEPSYRNKVQVGRKPPCMRCRKRRVRCDKAMPCHNCRTRGFTCAYDAPLSKLRKRVADLEDHFADISAYENNLKQ